MADDKEGREKQAADEQRRQRERATQEALTRGDEAEPAGEQGYERHDRGAPEGNVTELDGEDPGRHLGDLDDALAEHDYPVTTDELVAAHGDHQLESEHGWRSVSDLLAPLEEETFASADEVRERLLGLLRRR